VSAKRQTARQAAAQNRKVEAPTQADQNICAKHRRYVYAGTTCKYCAAGYPLIGEDEMILATGEIVKLVDVDRPNLGGSSARAADLRARLADLD
jgi:hypothetical protein